MSSTIRIAAETSLKLAIALCLDAVSQLRWNCEQRTVTEAKVLQMILISCYAPCLPPSITFVRFDLDFCAVSTQDEL